MIMTYTITIEGRPVVTPRPRVLKRGFTYTPKTAKQAQESIAREWIEAYRETQIEGPVRINAEFVFSVPESWTKKKKAAAEAGEVKATSHATGDIDNLLKTVLDGLQPHAFLDDSAVVTVSASKRYAREGETAHMTITVIPIYERRKKV